MSLIKKTICLETKILKLKKKNIVQFDFRVFSVLGGLVVVVSFRLYNSPKKEEICIKV